jgi:hypothetical protein
MLSHTLGYDLLPPSNQFARQYIPVLYKILYLLAIANIVNMLKFESTSDKFNVDGDQKHKTSSPWNTFTLAYELDDIGMLI